MIAYKVPLGTGKESRPAGASDTRQLGQAEHVRRYWWVVIIVMVLGVLGALISTYSAHTTYTGRASLIVSSNDRSPDQDAVLVQGYVNYFNDSAYQDQLVSQAGVKESVTLSARAAAASPILLIESTSSTSSTAQSSATAVAQAFQTDINRGRDAEQAKQLKSLQDRLQAASGILDAAAGAGVAALQDQIAKVQADRTNRLQELQFRGGVSQTAPSLKANLAFGLFGGLVLGLLGALAVGSGVDTLRRRRDSRKS